MFFPRHRKKCILKFTWNLQGPRITTTILKKKNKIGSLTFPDIKAYCKVTVVKSVWY